MVESGIFYSNVIDPILKPMRKRINPHILRTDVVIDIACGTGAQVFEMAQKAKYVLGVDLSESMINYALKKRNKKNSSAIDFKLADATQLSEINDKQFSVASMSLALHQFNPDLHAQIINEMKRVAEKIILIDYNIPLPQNFYGFGSKTAEFFAGKEHHSNFKKYSKLGGLIPILENNGIKITHSKVFAYGSFHLVIGS